jgi:hypothetical protein
MKTTFKDIVNCAIKQKCHERYEKYKGVFYFAALAGVIIFQTYHFVDYKAQTQAFMSKGLRFTAADRASAL